MRKLEHYPLDRLIELVLADEMIDECRLDDGDLKLVLGDTHLHLAPGDARTFLIGMLRGRTWNASPPDAAGDAMRAPQDNGPRPTSTLDELLIYANLLDLIEDYAIHPGADAVTVHLWACSCTLAREEAIAFLADSIHDELLAMNRTSGPVRVRELQSRPRTSATPPAERRTPDFPARRAASW